MSTGSCNIGDLTLDSGIVLPNVEIAYTAYGTLNAERSNVVLVFHALTGASSCAEWWPQVIGKEKCIDTDEAYVICFNFLGSCYGSTGPQSINTTTGLAYGNSFPKITIRDIARSQLLALRSLGIEHAALGIGGSMGAMILFELTALEPAFFSSIVALAVAGSHSAWRIGFSSVIRKTIEQVAAASGYSEEGFISGMKLARQVAMLSYRSSEEFESRFAREHTGEIFQVESYLEHLGEKIAARFSPYSYLRLTEAMESYDFTVASKITSPVLCIGTSSDILYPSSEIKAFSEFFSQGSYKELIAPFGHDSFLVAQQEVAGLIAPAVQSALAFSSASFSTIY